MAKVKGHKMGVKTRIGKNKETFDDVEENENVLKKWYEGISDDLDDFKELSATEADQLRNEARMVLENDTMHYLNKCMKGPNRSDNQWLQTMMTKGTFQDRIAASVVLVQNSPVHGLNIIKNLVNLVKTSKKECTKVMEVLTDLFISDLLIPDRKLRLFEKQPLSLLEKLSNGGLVKRKFYLTLWYFEDQLKNEYHNFIQGIKAVGQDTVDDNREKSIIAMQKLLSGNPEQEVLILSSLVNKIGDPSAKVASKASSCLTNVLKEHPNMKTVVMEEIEKLLFRPNISPRAQYYGVCFLSQYLLTKDDEELTCRLIQLYFSFFKGCIKKGDVDSRMMSALLVGVNRSYPFAKKDMLQIKDHIETMYKIVHIAQFSVSLHALCLLFQVSDYDTGISDRFYSALYQKILDPRLSGSSHHAMFISLVFRAMTKDIQYSRVKVFVKRLLQICHYVPASLACGILVMISHMFKKNKNLQSLKLIATVFKEEDEESGEEHYEDIQIKEEHKEHILDNSDIEKNISEKHALSLGEESTSATPNHEIKSVTATWFHAANLKEISGKRATKLHNIYSRNPLFVGDELCVYTELVSLSSHFHPTVSLFANHLLEGKNIEYTGDPLSDFTLTRFLERWVFKNPKKISDEKAVSKHSRKMMHTLSGVKKLPVNSKEYLNAAESDIPVEELFMYRFLKKQQTEGKGPKEDDEDDSDVSSVASDEFEGMMDQLMGGKEEINFSEGISRIPNDTKMKNKKVKGSPDDSASSEEEEEEEEQLDGESDNSDITDSDADNESSIDELDSDEKNSESDGDLNYEKIKEEFSDLDELDGDNEDAITFDDDDDEDFAFTMSDVERDEDDHRGRKKSKKAVFKDKKMKKGIDSSVFAPAEEFAQMLEDTGDQIAKFGNLANISNKDNAGMKQLKWEMTRNQWIHGRRQKRKSGGKPTKKPSKKFKT